MSKERTLNIWTDVTDIHFWNNVQFCTPKRYHLQIKQSYLTTINENVDSVGVHAASVFLRLSVLQSA
jgi:hypothetical protein